jgi:hypothetical protein
VSRETVVTADDVSFQIVDIADELNAEVKPLCRHDHILAAPLHDHHEHS